MYDTSVLGINTGVPAAIFSITFLVGLQMAGGVFLVVLGTVFLALALRSLRVEPRTFSA